MLEKMCHRICPLSGGLLLALACVHIISSPLLANSDWKYVGVLDVPSRTRLCYWAPFDFDDLKNLEWYLALESEEEGRSCLLGSHPDALSSLWQISPDGDLWLKRQGRSVAIVQESKPSIWEVTRLVPFPEDLSNPANAILWASGDALTVLEDGQIWSMILDGEWSRADVPKFDMTGFVERGFVQTQSFIYYWGLEAGLLIHKRSGRIQRFLNDNWPDQLLEFEQFGTVWRVEGDEVSVRNDENELLFNLSQKALLTNDLLFKGIQVQGKDMKMKRDFIETVQSLASEYPFGFLLLGFLIGAASGLTGVKLIRRQRLENSGDLARAIDQDDVNGLNVIQLSGLSMPFQALVLSAPGMLSTDEIDLAIGNDMDQSPESQRSKRSKIIREVNNEAQLVIGYELVERDRDPVDRRKVTYRIKTVPKRLVNQIAKQQGVNPSRKSWSRNLQS